ncbi:MAG: MJ1477/TM1410 family putative glycoside hydrolase [Promethearchaeota archaeon]
MKKKYIVSLVIIGIVISAGIGYFIYITLFAPVEEYKEIKRLEFTLAGQEIDDFAYWLDTPDVNDIADSKYDLIIIDYSKYGDEETEFSASQVDKMQASGDKKKLLLAYISIGEAEDYRYYWQQTWDADGNGIPDGSAPDWLDNENPEWEGNYKVRFWKKGWKDIIFDYLDRILIAGFDGIYMDIIDAYEYYEETIAHSDWLMIDFVGNISNYVKTQSGSDFLVFPQNGDELVKNETYLSYIDGIGREDLFYNDNDKTDNDWREQGINNLNRVLEDNKAVLVTDYPTEMDKIYDFYTKTIEDCGYLAYAAERDLDNLKEYDFYLPT